MHATVEPLRVLITGASGFIGLSLIERLLKHGINIRVLTRGDAKVFQDRVEYVQGSLQDRSALERSLEDVQAVYHLANPVGSNWQQYVDEMVNPTALLAQLSASAGVKNFFFASSVDLYDSSRVEARITGDTPADPDIARRNHYARAKHACETHLRQVDRQNDLRVTIFRLGLTIGKGASHAHRGVGHFSSPTVVRLWGAGRHRLPFILVDDAADAMARSLTNPQVAGRTLLLSAPPSLTARDYMKAVAARAHKRVYVWPYAVWLFWAADALKESIKHLLRHPNRRSAHLHDWKCRSHRADYDPTTTMHILDWNPVSDRETLIARGVNPAVDQIINRTVSRG
ncbi:MAG: NAD(P)-dependent oxidoreductase [Sphingobium sp.]|nr:NAD(P)-dependent oxidoreductase [Sphingobium sp.]